jgi:hypothetical protein
VRDASGGHNLCVHLQYLALDMTQPYLKGYQ